MDKWDLSKIFSSIEDMKRDLEKLSHLKNVFKSEYKDEIAWLDSGEMKEALKRYAIIVSLKCKIDSYAYLLYSTNLNDEEICSFYQATVRKLNEISKSLNFFKIELGAISGRIRNSFLPSDLFSRGEKAWLQKIVKKASHLREENIEGLLSDLDIVNESLIRFYNTTRSSEKYEIEGQVYSEGGVLSLISDEDEKIRNQAGQALAKAYDKNKELFTMIYNNLMYNRLLSSSWHKYESPEDQAAWEDDITSADLGNLVDVVQENYANVSRRYYDFKAKILGKKTISYWDRIAPYPISSKNRKYSVEEAKKIILDAFEKFSPEFAKEAQACFDENRIDYYSYSGKDSGAYCMEMPVGVKPYVFLNFNGTIGCVLTMAHELGHAVHEAWSKEQGELGRYHSCAQAETASIFAEQLVFNALYEEADTPEDKFVLLASFVEELIATSFRQIAFHLFEHETYKLRQMTGELSSDKLSEIWMRVMKDYLGDSVDISDIHNMWSGISHFFQYSFYVYSYCFSLCMVNLLYATYLQGNVENFEAKYVEMLKRGGVEDYIEALAHFGIDTSPSEFWADGIKLISQYIDKLEKLASEIDWK